MQNRFKLVSLLILIFLLNLGGIGLSRAANESSIQFRYFEQTGHSISGAIWQFYNRTGGAERHGAPITELMAINGKYQQFFEYSVMEFNPVYSGTSAVVKLIPLGSLLTAGQSFPPVTPFANNPKQWYFPETGHSLSFGFLDFWRNHGERESLGLPISEEVADVDEKGQKITVQYLEYARLEYHPELAGTEKSIQLGTLGRKWATGQAKDTDLAAIPLSKLSPSRTARIPSLLFHYVRTVDRTKDSLGYDLSVTPENFVKFADWIQQNGYHTVTIAQINDYLRYGIPLPDKPVNLRFDDGHADQWFAYQELKKRGMTATFYVITQRLELTSAQWQQIDADGFEVASHTRTHPDLRTTRDLEGEIGGSKRDLEAMLGHPVRTFAYPYGEYAPRILQMVQDSGYEMAASTIPGYAWKLDNTLLAPTIRVRGEDNLTGFAAIITGAAKAPLNNYTPASATKAVGTPGSATKAAGTPSKAAGTPNSTAKSVGTSTKTKN